MHARIERLVYGAMDPRTGAVDSALQLLTAPKPYQKITALGGVLAKDSADLLKQFFQSKRLKQH